jgi:hypothetical protein
MMTAERAVRRFGGLVVLALGASGCASARAAKSAEDPFIITFWCSPPSAQFTDERAEEIARAGFNVVGPPCEGGKEPADNRRVLEVAARHDLHVWVADDRLWGDAPDWRSRVRSAVRDYRGHPALAGYFLEDEPARERLPVLRAVMAEVEAADPGRLCYVNLLPDYAPTDTATYVAYLDEALSALSPRLISYDYYPFLIDGDRSSFFTNMAQMRARSRARGVPFMLVLQAMPHGPYRDPTEEEIAWQAFHALAYGARGISYFSYWTPSRGSAAKQWNFRDGLIVEGAPTEHYFQAMRVNRVVAALGRELASFRSDSITEGEGGQITIGLFSRGPTHAALLVNRNYRAPTTARLAAPPGAHVYEFSVDDRSWKEVQLAELQLPAAGARLLRWR